MISHAKAQFSKQLSERLSELVRSQHSNFTPNSRSHEPQAIAGCLVSTPALSRRHCQQAMMDLWRHPQTPAPRCFLKSTQVKSECHQFRTMSLPPSPFPPPPPQKKQTKDWQHWLRRALGNFPVISGQTDRRSSES